MKQKFKIRELLLLTLILIDLFGFCVLIPTTTTTTKSILDSYSITLNENENEIFDNVVDYNVVNSEILNERAKYAKRMLSYMNQSVDPCDDFYEYACGNWKNVIDERQTNHKRCNILDTAFKLNDVVKELIENQRENPDTRYKEEVELMLQFYDSCLKADLYPFKASEAYLSVINEIGGFPAVDENWDPDEFSWFNMSSHLTNYGAEGLINEKIIPQYPFPPYFELPELGFDSNVHTDNIASADKNAYKLNEARMRVYLEGYGVTADNATEIIAEIFEFWRTILRMTDEYNEDPIMCKAMVAKNGVEKFDQWSNHFSIAWNDIDFEIMDTECPCDYYYVELDQICNEHKHAAANYLAMRFLYAMDAKIKKPEFQEESCVTAVRFGFPYLIDQLYLKEYFNKDIEQEVADLVKEQHKSLHLALKEAVWLDDSVRETLLRRESDIAIRIGKFDDPSLVSLLIKEMNNLTFDLDNYEQNKINLNQLKTSTKRYLGLHHQEISNETKPLELMVAMQVQAFFYMIDNSINVMAGILHPPAYHKSWPNILKFATIGYLVGHEFTHGFDSNGAYYDYSMEKLQNFSEKADTEFKERVDCFVNHYNDYLVPEINRHINGNLTRDENIADSGGLNHGLSAYYRYMKELSKSTDTSVYKYENMPGIDLTVEQLYFLGFAQLWCADYKEEHYWEELTNVHTMDKYRVLGAVTNVEDFSKAYKCPLGSKMNPTAKKCRLW